MRRPAAIAATVLVVGALAIGVVASTPSPPDPRPWRGATVGVSPGAGLGSLPMAALDADLDRMVDAGITAIRIDVDWSHIERRRGRLDWTATDRLVRAARDRGLLVLGLAAYTPAWARPDGTSDKHPPTRVDDFAEFVGAAASRYRGDVLGWEIWNEPNLRKFWRPSPDPAGYAELLVAATAAIRPADPLTSVVSGGLAPAADEPGVQLSPETFLRRTYRTLPPGTVDAVGIHPYSFPGRPSGTAAWNPFARLPQMRDIVAAAEGRQLPLWLTEFGAPYDADLPERQADIVAEGVTCATQWDWIGPIFLFSTRELPGSGSDLDFGLLDGDGAPRPAWRRVAELIAVPDGEPVVSACDAIEDPTP